MCFALYSALFTDRILHLIRETWKYNFFDVSEGGRRFDNPFDPYGWLIVLTLCRMQFMYRIFHIIRETAFDDIEGGRRFNNLFDPYGSLSVLTLCRALFTDHILHVIRGLR